MRWAADPVAESAAFLGELSRALDAIPCAAVARATDILLDAAGSGARIYAFGNGGSAATASHLVCDLEKTAQVPGERAVRAFALNDNAALVTAWANDVDFERAYAEQVAALVEHDDVVVAISVSGSSANVVAALRAAADIDARTIALVGADASAAAALADVAINVPSNDYGVVESAHLAIVHAFTRVLARRAVDAPLPG